MSTVSSDGNKKLFTIQRRSHEAAEPTREFVAMEEALEIRALHWFKDVPKVDSLAVLMRTPGFDRELVAGYMVGEGIIQHRGQLLDLHSLGSSENSNEYLAELSREVELEPQVANLRFVHTSCRACGKRGLEAMAEPWIAPALDLPKISSSALLRLGQHVFAGREPTSLFTASLADTEGNLEATFLDVSLPNALHKVLGHCLLDGKALGERAIFISGIASFELVAKVIAAGCPILISRGTPSSLAIEAARERHVTLVGLACEAEFRVYSGQARIVD
jgi:FdhD protein